MPNWEKKSVSTCINLLPKNNLREVFPVRKDGNFSECSWARKDCSQIHWTTPRNSLSAEILFSFCAFAIKMCQSENRGHRPSQMPYHLCSLYNFFMRETRSSQVIIQLYFYADGRRRVKSDSPKTSKTSKQQTSQGYGVVDTPFLCMRVARRSSSWEGYRVRVKDLSPCSSSKVLKWRVDWRVWGRVQDAKCFNHWVLNPIFVRASYTTQSPSMKASLRAS